MNRLVNCKSLTLVTAVTLFIGGCDDDDDSKVTRDAATDAPATDGATGDARAPDGGPGGDVAMASLYTRLGGETGIRTVVTDFVVNRVLKDVKINGYFLNAAVSGTKLIDCLVLQLGNATGGPQMYPNPTAGCRDMKTSHRGLKISMQDFSDLAGHLVDALKAAGVAQADIDTIVGVLTPMANDIVEDKNNNASVYHRIGRKPAIATVIDKFIVRVVADARINGFFGTTNAGRLKTCLVRQVCGIDGPCKYGEEVTHESEPGVTAMNVCKSMKAVHMGLTSPPGGGAGAKTIAKADFDALVEDLVKELDAANVSAADKMAILGALGATCDDIVAGGVGCPGRTVVALTTTNTLVSFDSKTPMTLSTPVPVTGLAAGDSLVGITIRPTGARLYGLGSGSRLYEVNRTTGAATLVGPGPFSPALSGTHFGFDFNPTVDRIRVTSDTQQNLRLHPDMGTVVDFDAMMAGTQPDPNLDRGGVAAVAYTNSVVGAMTTTIYGIDFMTDSFVRIGGPGGMPSPNLGATTRIGALGVDTAAPVGFDIAPGSDAAFAVLQVAGSSQLYSIALASGTATLVGTLSAGVGVRAIAVVP